MKEDHYFLRILINIMLFLVVLLIGGLISDYVFYSCPDRALATTEACIDPEIDALYEMIVMTKLILLIPMTFAFSMIVFKNADTTTKLRHRLIILTVTVVSLFFVASIGIFEKSL